MPKAPRARRKWHQLGHLRSIKRRKRVALADALLPRIEEEADSNDLLVYRCCQESWSWTPARNRCRFRRALLSKTWVIGFAFFFIGNVLNFLSFSYAAQSLLASLGSVQFITNVIFAKVVLKESLSTRVLIGTLVLIGGVAVVVEFSCHGNPAVKYSLNELIALFVDEEYLIYLAFLLCFGVCCQCYLRKTGSNDPNKDPARRSKLEAIAFAAVSAIVGAQAVTFFKIVSELMAIIASVSDNDDVTKKIAAKTDDAYPYIMVYSAAIFTSLFWIQRLNEALRIYDVLFIIPVFQVMWVTLSVVGGGIFFHEFADECFRGFRAFMFVIGLLTIFFGVFLLSAQPLSPEEDSVPAPDSNRSPLLHHDSFFASGGGMGMTLPTPTLVQAVSLRSVVSPFSSSSCSPELPPCIEPESTRSPSSLNFGLATFPVVDAVEARDQRSNSGTTTLPTDQQRSFSGSGSARGASSLA